MKVLVVGGAGYIGSHMVVELLAMNHEIVTLDNLSMGHRDAVLGGEFVQGDLEDVDLLSRLFASHQFDAVIHFAAFTEVAESVSNPDKYYKNNVDNTRNLLDAMAAHEVRHIVFSSTAAIFGEPVYTPIDEQHPKAPVNPYGDSKLKVEKMLQEFEMSAEIKSISLRYFNAAGADPQGRLGERRKHETHLIPLVLQAVSGRRSSISIFGEDYDTPDGTCVRDYIHVTDLCQAHLLALEYLSSANVTDQFNLGNGLGYSVRQVIDTVREQVGLEFEVKQESRRDGDPAILVADSTKARSVLGWSPQNSDLETIIQTAWNWEQSFTIQ